MSLVVFIPPIPKKKEKMTAASDKFVKTDYITNLLHYVNKSSFEIKLSEQHLTGFLFQVFWAHFHKSLIN